MEAVYIGLTYTSTHQNLLFLVGVPINPILRFVNKNSTKKRGFGRLRYSSSSMDPESPIPLHYIRNIS